MEHNVESQPPVEPLRKPPQRRHWWIGATILLSVTGAALWRLLPNGVPHSPHGLSPQSQPPVSVSLQTVAPLSTPRWLEVTGTVRSEFESLLSSKAMGRVEKVLVREGERVHRGQILIVLDASDLVVAVAQAHADLRSASIGYESARLSAQLESASSRARIAEARAKVAQSEAALRAARAKRKLIEAGPRRQERQQATLAVAQAQSNFALAENNLKRMATLYQEGAISAQQYDQFQSQYDVAKVQLETAQQGRSIAEEGSRAEEIQAAEQAVLQAEAAVQEARATLNSAQASELQVAVRQQEAQGAVARIRQSQAGLQRAVITRGEAFIASPFDGIVTKRLADPGVMANPGVPLLRLQGGALRLEAVVPESALASVKQGASVPITIDSLRNRAIAGRVVEIAPQGDADSHTFIVKIELPHRNGVSEGMFGRAHLTTGMETRLLVPSSAFQEREGLHTLFVVDENGLARLRMVTIGDPERDLIPVLSGLNAGERIVARGAEHLHDGSPVAAGSW